MTEDKVIEYNEYGLKLTLSPKKVKFSFDAIDKTGQEVECDLSYDLENGLELFEDIALQVKLWFYILEERKFSELKREANEYN